VTGGRVSLALLLVLVGVVGSAGPVSAHETAATGVVRLAQTLGTRELTVTLVPPMSGSGRMTVDLEALGTGGGGPVRVRAEPVGTPGATPADAWVVPGRTGAPGSAALTLDRPGRWDVVLDDAGAQASIPMTWSDPGTTAWVWVVRLGVLVAVVAGIAATTRTARQRPRRAGILAGLAAAGAAAAATALALGTGPVPAAYVVGGEASGPPAAAGPGGTAGMTGMAGMPPGTAGMAGPAEGAVVLTPTLAGSVLDLALTDSSTGSPVDDLVVHDEAFIHLAVLGADGSEAHLHPVRTGPGRWQVRFTPAAGGRYGLFAEFSRDGGDHQLARSGVDAPGPVVATVTPAGPGPRALAGGVAATVAADGATAGRPTRVRMDLTVGGRPVTDVQAWLGMAGHLFVLGPGSAGTPDPLDVGSSFAHVHDMQTALPGRGFGPDFSFDYTFPRPGTYRLWLQVLRGGAVVTVPVDVPVAPAPTAT
jgi:hypothetical protein